MTDAPRLHSNSQTISLSFETTLIQSCMRLDDPNDLVLDYTRTMMGFLLMNPAPASVLMIGLGGGAMLKYLHQHLPEVDITTVEISQSVIDLRHDFCLPDESERQRIVCADGARFVAKPPRLYDVILVDGFSGQGLPEALCSRSFYQHCRSALAPHGLMVANVQADTQQTQGILKRIDKAFEGCLIAVESDEGGNQIVTAGTRSDFEQCCVAFENRWAALAPVHRETLAVSSLRMQRALIKGFRPALAPTTTPPP
jgi:spermidine synthase